MALVARLLVVDDDPRIRHLLELLLSGAGHQVVLADSAKAALEHLRRETPDLILLDIMMPDMDGLTLLGRIRAVRRLAKVPVIMFTGGGKELEGPSRALGADLFLEKPVSGRRLKEVVENLLAREGYVLPGGERVNSLEEVGSRLRHALPEEARFKLLWRKTASRRALLQNLLAKGWTEALLRRILPGEYDLYDLLGHLAFGWPLVPLRERAARVQDPRLASHLEAYLKEKRLPLEGNGLLEELAQALYA
ncbi:response regulator [Thermus sp. PS18]|uniref:response regulator n=1 Tax=Thermus sp. PS18 TaxID=2849039 RepID=UPI00226556FC|nr:response regulator [Thermus sp. PS18]UZX15250.1 response regulator [Thermus sp. PS18]